MKEDKTLRRTIRLSELEWDTIDNEANRNKTNLSNIIREYCIKPIIDTRIKTVCEIAENQGYKVVDKNLSNTLSQKIISDNDREICVIVEKRNDAYMFVMSPHELRSKLKEYKQNID